MQLTIKINSTGAPDAQDRATMRYLVDQENLRRIQYNAQIAFSNAQPGATQTPSLPILPSSTAQELRSSFEAVLSEQAQATYRQYGEQQEQAETQAASFRAVKQAFAQQTDPAKRTSAIAAFKAALA
ncbi:MAG: hypothetical protein ABL921_21375 [Pirellula sp.]